jgi:hypothetical protein
MSSTYTSRFITTAIACALMLLIAMPAFAAENSGGLGSHQFGKKRNVNLSCMQDALMTREDAIATAWTTFSTSITTALAARKTALSTAWASTTATTSEGTHKGQRITAWTKWKKASHEAHVALKKARKAAWDAFRTTSKNNCRTSVTNEEKLDTDKAGEVAL